MSAVFACSIDRRADQHLPVYVANNPLACDPIPPNVPGATVEQWVAEPAGTPGEFQLTKKAAV